MSASVCFKLELRLLINFSLLIVIEVSEIIY